MDSLTRHYAFSLFGLIDKKDASSYLESLKEIDALLKQQADFLRLLTSRAISIEEKEKIIDSTFGKKITLPYLVDFLKVISKHHRFNKFHDIMLEFETLVNEENGVEEGIVYSAEKLDKKQLSRLEEALAKKLGRKVSLYNEVEPSLIGGVKVAIAGKVFDNSLRHKLIDLQHTLKGGSL